WPASNYRHTDVESATRRRLREAARHRKTPRAGDGADSRWAVSIWGSRIDADALTNPATSCQTDARRLDATANRSDSMRVRPASRRSVRGNPAAIGAGRDLSRAPR